MNQSISQFKTRLLLVLKELDLPLDLIHRKERQLRFEALSKILRTATREETEMRCEW